MPQMAPLSWLGLFLIFSTIFLLINYINYFIYFPNKPSNMTRSHKFNPMNWKW